MRKEWEEAHNVTEELVEGPPSRRANATFTASPDGVSMVPSRGTVGRFDQGATGLESYLGDWRRVLQRRRKGGELTRPPLI